MELGTARWADTATVICVMVMKIGGVCVVMVSGEKDLDGSENHANGKWTQQSTRQDH